MPTRDVQENVRKMTGISKKTERKTKYPRNAPSVLPSPMRISKC
jgi:hypothetical protein